MGSKRYAVYNTVDTATLTSAEVVVATLAGVTADQPGQKIGLRGQLIIGTGAGTTGLTLTIRRGGLTGTIVGEPPTDTLFAAVGSTETHDTYVEDTSDTGFIGRTYVLTVTAVGATANGNVPSASLEAEVSP